MSEGLVDESHRTADDGMKQSKSTYAAVGNTASVTPQYLSQAIMYIKTDQLKGFRPKP